MWNVYSPTYIFVKNININLVERWLEAVTEKQLKIIKSYTSSIHKSLEK